MGFLIGIVAHFRGWKLSKKWYVILLCTELLWSTFAAWDDKYTKIQATYVPKFETTFETVMLASNNSLVGFPEHRK